MTDTTQLICEESGYLPADYTYVTPNDGKVHHVSAAHLQNVKHRMQALGYIDRGWADPDLVTFHVIDRPRPAAEKIDWMAVASGYAADLEALRALLAESERRREWAEGEIAVREHRLAELQKELGEIQHLLKLT